jgi:hypothetical protein
MNEPTQIMSWQMSDAQQNATAIHPMYFKWKADMHAAVITDTTWVDTSTRIDIEGWKRFRFHACKYGFTAWDQSPDANFNKLFNVRANALQSLYMHVYTLMATFSYDPILSDIYREKYEQALSHIITPKVPAPAMIRIESPRDQSPALLLTKAENIAKMREKWVTKISTIEGIRLQVKQTILKSVDINLINSETAKAVTQLQELYVRWIST